MSQRPGSGGEPLRLISLPGWLWLAVLTLSILSGVAYGFLGVVTRVADGTGVSRYQMEILAVDAPQAGIVREILVERGAEIVEGTPILRLSSDVLESEIDASKELRDLLRQEYQRLQSRESKMMADAGARRDAAVLQAEEARENATELLKVRREVLVSQQQLLTKGLISRETMLQARTTVAALESRIVRASTAAANAQLDVAQLERDVAASQAARREAQQNAEAKISTLERRLAEGFTMRSLLDGKVENIFTQIGAVVERGDMLARLTPTKSKDNTLRVAAVIPQAKGKELSIGDEVQLVPTFVDKSRYGFMKGKLIWITTYAAPEEELELRMTNRQEFLSLESDFGPLLLAEIELQTDTGTPSGFAWSTEHGWPGPIGPGVEFDVQVIFGTDRPVELLFPWIKSLMGQ